jgi:outer membrane biosynthesis protein TonB
MRPRTTTTLILALAAGLAAGCGSDDEQDGAPIPQQAAVDLEARLAEVERRIEAGGGACADIQNDTLPAVASIIDSLPENVDPDVRDALEQSFDRLFQLTEEQCDEQKGQETETQAEPPPETETTETLPPEEEEDDDEEEEPPPTEEIPPPEEVPPTEVPPGEGQGGDSGSGAEGGSPGQGGGGGALVPGGSG